MLRRNHIITAAALALVCSVPASAGVALADPHALDAVNRGPHEVERGPYVLERNYGSPDALDAAKASEQDETGRSPQSLGRSYGSPDALDAARDLPPVQIPAPTVQVRDVPSGGFDWGDAGIGAAGMLALLSIAAGSTLLATSWKRRRGVQVATH